MREYIRLTRKSICREREREDFSAFPIGFSRRAAKMRAPRAESAARRPLWKAEAQFPCISRERIELSVSYEILGVSWRHGYPATENTHDRSGCWCSRNVTTRCSRQCIVTLLACPPPRVNRLSTPLPLYSFSVGCVRTCPHRTTARPYGWAKWGKPAERAYRVARKAQNHYRARPRGVRTCFSLPELSRDLAPPCLLSPHRLSLCFRACAQSGTRV